MNPSQKAILHAFDEHVFGSMRTELDWTIPGRATHLAALGLVTYTEFLGGIATGDLGRQGCSGSNFRAFLRYLGSDYEQLAQRGVDIYERVRRGLAHEYFIKGESTISAEAERKRDMLLFSCYVSDRRVKPQYARDGTPVLAVFNAKKGDKNENS